MVNDRRLSSRAIELFTGAEKRHGLHVEMAASGNALYLYDVIGEGGVSAIDLAAALDPMKGPVDLFLSSPGGSAFDGFAMCELLARRGGVTVYIDSLAASAATILMLGAEKIVAAERAQVMIHNSSGLCYGQKQDMIQTAELLERMDSNAAEAYAARTSKPVADIAAAMAAETWFTAKEAVQYGLVDEIAKAAPKQPKMLAGAAEVEARKAIVARLLGHLTK